MRNLLIGFIIGIIIMLIFKGCSNDKINTIIETTKSDTIFTKGKDTTIYKKGKDIIKYKDTTIYKTSENISKERIDTLYILGEYFSSNIYTDSLKLKEGLIIIKDTISKNEIVGRSYLSNIGSNVITNNITRTIRENTKSKLYIGAMYNDKLNSGIIYENKMNNTLYMLNYDWNGKYSAGIYIKIK